MDRSTCPYCNKIINHRGKCLVLRKREQQEQKELQNNEKREREELEKKNKLELEEELNLLEATYPQFVQKFKLLIFQTQEVIDENRALQDQIGELRANSHNLSDKYDEIDNREIYWGK